MEWGLWDERAGVEGLLVVGGQDVTNGIRAKLVISVLTPRDV